MGHAAAEVEMVVKQDFEVVAEVRRFVRLVAGQWDMDDFAPCLVASELVTNALRYASEEDGDVTLRLGRTEDGALWMEVQDGTCELPYVQEPDMISEVGRGLMIVEQVARCWASVPWLTTPARSSSRSSTAPDVGGGAADRSGLNWDLAISLSMLVRRSRSSQIGWGGGLVAKRQGPALPSICP
ncbi:ATP-binding protein [Actinomadura sp. 7K507]|uniref:ATP-binding protein n=1 Tax=Actinomadura sp. 7K507 TaxID=2530365 RepID=UPI001050D398|nr:ATP-binding protein [Actinomadura sp. 7K507]TDC95611.1 hypothetical protein E1285_07010 [Actinomadura sp. 7K507]